MSNQQKHNFGAGPCILPISVTEEAAEAARNWNGMGLSILEVSHRSAEFSQVMQRCEALVRELLEVPTGYQVLFLQGGASRQFEMLAQNLLTASGKCLASYLDTGYFSSKAIAQAELFGEVEIAGSGKSDRYRSLPEFIPPDADSAYLHLTSNNTIEGTQISQFPKTTVPLVCDMSSDIFSRQVNVADFGLVYAGAQKNLGPAGMTLVIISEQLLKGITGVLPATGDYRVMASEGSLYNTPPVFAIYTAMLNLLWLKDQGGVQAIEKLNAQKARTLYAALDRSETFYGLAAASDRSMMNVTFKCHDPDLEKPFLSYVSQRGILGLAGHSSVGGFRASLYNALPLHSVEYLAQLMHFFEADCKLRSAAGPSFMAKQSD